MKRRLLSLFTLTALLVSTFAAGFNPAWAQSTLSDSLTAFWKMDELSGTRSDSVGASALVAYALAVHLHA